MSDIPADLLAALAQRFELRSILGRGGMATVYLGHDRKHQRDVAVKVLRPDLAASIGADRFLKEILVEVVGVPEAALGAVIPLWLLATYATARTAYFYSTRRRQRTLEQLADRLAELATELAPQRPALRGPQAKMLGD